MIRMEITERMIFEANELFEETDLEVFKTRKDFKDEHLLIGTIGEIAVISYCWENDLLAFKPEGRSNDIRLHSGHTIEVKTQKCSSEPKANYKVNFSARHKEIETSDFCFFNRIQFVAGRPEFVWLLGGCSRDKFFRMASFHVAGDPMTDIDQNGVLSLSGRFYSTDCYDLPISQLAPPSAALKHFKSLQQKEQTQ